MKTMPVVLGVTIENAREFRGMGVRFAAQKKEALNATAAKWHSDLLDRHFTPENKTRYGMQERSRYYLDNIKRVYGQGQGKWVDLKLSEKSSRWMKVFVKITGTSSQATVRMRPPIYFASPFIGSFVDNRGKTKRVTQQPDKPAEVTRLNEQDRAVLRDFMQERLKKKIASIVRSS